MIVKQTKNANPHSVSNQAQYSHPKSLIESRYFVQSRSKVRHRVSAPSKQKLSSLEYKLLMNSPELNQETLTSKLFHCLPESQDQYLYKVLDGNRSSKISFRALCPNIYIQKLRIIYFLMLTESYHPLWRENAKTNIESGNEDHTQNKQFTSTRRDSYTVHNNSRISNEFKVALNILRIMFYSDTSINQVKQKYFAQFFQFLEFDYQNFQNKLSDGLQQSHSENIVINILNKYPILDEIFIDTLILLIEKKAKQEGGLNIDDNYNIKLFLTDCLGLQSKFTSNWQFQLENVNIIIGIDMFSLDYHVGSYLTQIIESLDQKGIHNGLDVSKVGGFDDQVFNKLDLSYIHDLKDVLSNCSESRHDGQFFNMLESVKSQIRSQVNSLRSTHSRFNQPHTHNNLNSQMHISKKTQHQKIKNNAHKIESVPYYSPKNRVTKTIEQVQGHRQQSPNKKMSHSKTINYGHPNQTSYQVDQDLQMKKNKQKQKQKQKQVEKLVEINNLTGGTHYFQSNRNNTINNHKLIQANTTILPQSTEKTTANNHTNNIKLISTNGNKTEVVVENKDKKQIKSENPESMKSSPIVHSIQEIKKNEIKLGNSNNNNVQGIKIISSNNSISQPYSQMQQQNQEKRDHQGMNPIKSANNLYELNSMNSINNIQSTNNLDSLNANINVTANSKTHIHHNSDYAQPSSTHQIRMQNENYAKKIQMILQQSDKKKQQQLQSQKEKQMQVQLQQREKQLQKQRQREIQKIKEYQIQKQLDRQRELQKVRQEERKRLLEQQKQRERQKQIQRQKQRQKQRQIQRQLQQKIQQQKKWQREIKQQLQKQRVQRQKQRQIQRQKQIQRQILLQKQAKQRQYEMQLLKQREKIIQLNRQKERERQEQKEKEKNRQVKSSFSDLSISSQDQVLRSMQYQNPQPKSYPHVMRHNSAQQQNEETKPAQPYYFSRRNSKNQKSQSEHSNQKRAMKIPPYTRYEPSKQKRDYVLEHSNSQLNSSGQAVIQKPTTVPIKSTPVMTQSAQKFIRELYQQPYKNASASLNPYSNKNIELGKQAEREQANQDRSFIQLKNKIVESGKKYPSQQYQYDYKDNSYRKKNDETFSSGILDNSSIYKSGKDTYSIYDRTTSVPIINGVATNAAINLANNVNSITQPSRAGYSDSSNIGNYNATNYGMSGMNGVNQGMTKNQNTSINSINSMNTVTTSKTNNSMNSMNTTNTMNTLNSMSIPISGNKASTSVSLYTKPNTVGTTNNIYVNYNQYNPANNGQFSNGYQASEHGREKSFTQVEKDINCILENINNLSNNFKHNQVGIQNKNQSHPYLAKDKQSKVEKTQGQLMWQRHKLKTSHDPSLFKKENSQEIHMAKQPSSISNRPSLTSEHSYSFKSGSLSNPANHNRFNGIVNSVTLNQNNAPSSAINNVQHTLFKINLQNKSSNSNSKNSSTHAHRTNSQRIRQLTKNLPRVQAVVMPLSNQDNNHQYINLGSTGTVNSNTFKQKQKPFYMSQRMKQVGTFSQPTTINNYVGNGNANNNPVDTMHSAGYIGDYGNLSMNGNGIKGGTGAGNQGVGRLLAPEEKKFQFNHNVGITRAPAYSQYMPVANQNLKM